MLIFTNTNILFFIMKIFYFNIYIAIINNKNIYNFILNVILFTFKKLEQKTKC